MKRRIIWLLVDMNNFVIGKLLDLDQWFVKLLGGCENDSQ